MFQIEIRRKPASGSGEPVYWRLRALHAHPPLQAQGAVGHICKYGAKALDLTKDSSLSARLAGPLLAQKPRALKGQKHALFARWGMGKVGSWTPYTGAPKA